MKGKLKKFVLTSALVFTLALGVVGNAGLMPTYEVKAVIGQGGEDQSTAQSRLRDSIDTEIADKTYTSSDGDTVKGSEIVKDGLTTDKFADLPSNEKQKVIQDAKKAADAQVSTDKEAQVDNAVTKTVIDDWVKVLQNQKGVGPTLIATLTDGIQADFVGGQRVLSPFMPLINVVIGALLALVIVAIMLTTSLDLLTLALPSMQQMVLNNKGGGNGAKSFLSNLVSVEAINSVQIAHDNNQEGTHYIGAYMKSRAMVYVLFGVAIWLLASGEMWTITGVVINGVDGVLGFFFG